MLSWLHAVQPLVLLNCGESMFIHVFLSFFFLPLYCLFFALQLLMTSLYFVFVFSYLRSRGRRGHDRILQISTFFNDIFDDTESDCYNI
jgi:hypothetical protein